jgi:hypothetical protein
MRSLDFQSSVRSGGRRKIGKVVTTDGEISYLHGSCLLSIRAACEMRTLPVRRLVVDQNAGARTDAVLTVK